MADPFSITAASAGLIEILWNCSGYVKKILESAGKIDETIFGLDHEIGALISVNKSLEEAYNAENIKFPGTSLVEKARVESLWHNVGTLLQDCQKTVEELAELLSEVSGTASSATSKLGGKIDNLKKSIRMDIKDDEFKKIRLRLVNYQNSLQVLLTALTLAYTRSSQDSTDLSLGYLSQEMQTIGFKLQSQIASLRPRLVSIGSTHFLDAINSAAAVANLVSINKHFYIPQTVSSIFTGRQQLLADLQGYFDVFGESTKPTSIQKRFIVYGLGGSGKTQFCCKFAQHNRQNFWGIFCIDATSPETAEHSFSKILKIGKVEPSEGSSQRAAKDWLSSLDHPWLLTIDNADDPSHPLEDYFPDGERGYILVTTRDPTKKVHGTVGPKFYHFEQLETDEANNLLLKAACQPTPWDLSIIKSADSIAAALGFLPLALVQAGRAIMNGICSLANYTDHYHMSWQRIRHARRNSRYKGNETTNWNVYSSYEINLKNLEESNDEEALDAVELLKMFSCFHCENIRIDFLITAAVNPAVEREQRQKDQEEEARMKLLAREQTWKEYFRDTIFGIFEFVTRDRGPAILPGVLRDERHASLFDELRLRYALGRLCRMSLITHHESSDIYSMHPLVHTWVRERPEMSITEGALWCQAATTALAQSILLPPHGSSEKEEDMRRSLLPHINHVRKCQMDISLKIANHRKGRKFTWMPALTSGFGRRQALEFAKFSRVYQECGLWNEAEELQVAVKVFICDKLGNEHPAAIAIMLFLSATYWNQARTNEAAELQEQVYRACLKSLGPDHPRTLKVMDTLGSSKCFQGRYKDSLQLHEKAIEGMKKTPLAKEEDLYIAMGNLGRILWRYFRYGEAKDAHTQALQGLRRILGPTHLQTLTAMEDLAMSYLDCGEEWLERAHDLMIEVLSQREFRLGKEQPFTLLAICNLARVKSAMDQTAEAEELFRDAIPIAERSLGMNHFGTLSGKAHFARVLVRQKRYDEAEEIFIKVVEKQRYASAAREDGDHPDRIFALWYLVECYALHGKVDDALERVDELDEIVATIGGEGLGKLHPIQKRLAVKRGELERAQGGIVVFSYPKRYYGKSAAPPSESKAALYK
ncbi:Uncharacterized protein BP5553_03183 [Venustampulla echinocandica]|uniref:NB-ARC domain-containing protein n=1 Tax=Venustampulla echinocandica TaxID=2656787 RepID=A0A370TTK3_9HELO|nr:Uncharacterized protein BP5553_03183 [Venustampulla echinocandica]RDL38843.1 Uncharacterized protein BP5553_03183 [Venustampulla echinocandica]